MLWDRYCGRKSPDEDADVERDWDTNLGLCLIIQVSEITSPDFMNTFLMALVGRMKPTS